MNIAPEPVVRNQTDPLDKDAFRFSPDGAVRGMLLASARTRFAIAIVLSIALWAGYFWVAGHLSLS